MAKLKKDGTVSKQGQGGGQPPRFKTEEELKTKILAYFQDADSKKRMYSKAGLLWMLDISRPVYAEYKRKYPNSIRFAEILIEEDWVNRLSETGATGAIFYLKNAFKDEYRDRTETDLMSGGKPIPLLGNVRKNNRNRKDSGTK